MSDEKKKNKLSFLDNLGFVKKLKQVKHIGLIVVVIFVLILLLILFNDFDFLKSNNESVITETSTYTSYYQYAEKLEKKLKNVLGKIKGAGNVDVMVTLDGGTTMQIATDDEKTTVTNGSQTSITVSSSTILVDNEGQETPIITGESLPTITGVVVVSSGASDINVRLNLLTAVQTLLDIAQNKIQIFVGN